MTKASISFRCVLEKFKDKGEKTGWVYITIPATKANELKPGVKTSFRVKGKIDQHPIKQVALLPMGEGVFILPVNAAMRKGIQKPIGNKVMVSLSVDKSEFKFSDDFLTCLEDEPKALEAFRKLAPSHQRYFSKWIESAKTEATKVKRITQSIHGLSMGFDYGQMVRYFQEKKTDR
jgi:hypothetical protein